MARYRGPRVRILRRLGTELPGLTTKSNARRPTPPGHAAAMNKRFPKHSEHALRLREKQKLRYHFGLHEKQMRLFFQRAQRMPGDTGRNLLNLLEGRLDNLVWRAGFVRTMPAARQLVSHGHVMLDGHRSKTPSQVCSVGQTITLNPKCLKREDIRLSANNPVIEPPAGLIRDLDQLSVKLEALPSVEQVPIKVDIQKVIEFYSR